MEWETDQEKLQRKKFPGEKENPWERLLRAHMKRGATLWEEHEQTLASERERREERQLAALAGVPVGRRKQGSRNAKGLG